MRHRTAIQVGWAVALVLTLASNLFVGCTPSPRPADASPIVEADSVEGRRATDETTQLIQLRRKQEASARHRVRSLPAEG